jgi:peptidoglycan/xylan/chitin deacetylase (PgdA/CDA1 family)
MVTSAEVRELAAFGHESGAHTVTHPKLTKVSLGTARTEIESSKDFLEDFLHSEVVSFAYPKGDHNEAVRALLGPLGFKPAVTVREE